MDLTFQDKIDAIRQLIFSTLGDDVGQQMLGGIQKKQPSEIEAATHVPNELSSDSAGANNVVLIDESSIQTVEIDSELNVGDVLTINNSSSVVSESETVNVVSKGDRPEQATGFDKKEFEDIVDLDVFLVRARYGKYGKLQNKDRNKLSKGIMKHLLTQNPNRQFDRDEFMAIANDIKEVFPAEEVETYFIPSESGVLASGSLYHAYRHYRDELGEVGFAKMRKRKRKFQEAVDDSVFVPPTDEEMNSLQVVESQSDPKSLIEVHWVKSREVRAELLAKLSNIAYVNHFPVLRMGNGFEWLFMDFEAKYPDAPKILESWPPLAKKIMDFAASRRSKPEHLKALLNSPEASTNSQVMAIKVLPLILKNNTKATTKLKKTKKSAGKKKSGKDATETESVEAEVIEEEAMETAVNAANRKKTFRNSKPEIALEFLQHFTNDSDRKSNESDDFPRMTLVGPSLDNCIMFVSIGNVDYGFADPVLGFLDWMRASNCTSR